MMPPTTCPLGAVPAAASAVIGRAWRLPPRRNRVLLTRGLHVPMQDGVTLIADHYAPAVSQARPTLLIRSPYGRGFEYGLMMAQFYAERGYHVLLQSTRGTFGSGGEFFPVVHEAADGQDTVAWLRGQDWFDGRLGTLGPSYLGFVQWALAMEPPPELKAMVVHFAPHDMARLAYGRGPFQLMFLLMWSEMVAHQEHIGMVRGTARMVRAEHRLAPVLSTLPMESVADGIGGAGAPWFREWASGPDPDGPHWDPYRANAALQRIDVPTLLVGGFQDAFLDQTLEQYQALRARGVEVGLTVGPWTHLGMDLSVIIPESLAWLDAHLAGEGPPPRTRPVRVWVGGHRTWRDLATWPPPAGITGQVWHLRAAGRLTPSAPGSGQEPATDFRYDPADPTPSVGGRVLSVGRAGQQDNTRLEARADVLTFTSVPLSRPVEVLGAPVARLRVSSDNPHIDLFARLCDVDRRGRSVNVTDQIIRVPAAGAGPGVARTVTITLDDTAHRFLAGHRIRLQVSAGAHPRYARNLGTGEPDGTGTTMMPATISIHHSAEHASALTLPATEC
jgi:putative CocE/NonD family hydrolase